MNVSVGPNVIVLYEPMANHKTGFNVFYGDGRVTFLSGPTAQRSARGQID